MESFRFARKIRARVISKRLPLSCERALLEPVDVEPALRKQP